MKNAFLIAASLFVLVAGAAAAADNSVFPQPSGWSRISSTAAADPNRTVQQWHIAGDVASVTFVHDTTTPYADAVAAIETNFSTNKIKPAVDKDLPCQGKTAHEVDFNVGPDGHQLTVQRVVVPDGTGVATVTYARAADAPFDPDVKKSETAFCASSGT